MLSTFRFLSPPSAYDLAIREANMVEAREPIVLHCTLRFNFKIYFSTSHRKARLLSIPVSHGSSSSYAF